MNGEPFLLFLKRSTFVFLKVWWKKCERAFSKDKRKKEGQARHGDRTESPIKLSAGVELGCRGQGEGAKGVEKGVV